MPSPLLMARRTLPGRTASTLATRGLSAWCTSTHLILSSLSVSRSRHGTRLILMRARSWSTMTELAVDVQRVSGQRHPEEADAEHREHLLDLARRLLVLAERQPGHRGRAVQQREAPALEEPAAVDGSEDRHPEPGDHAADVGLLAAPSHAGREPTGPMRQMMAPPGTITPLSRVNIALGSLCEPPT